MTIHINDLSYSPIVLKKGDKGDKIKKLHWILTQLGYQCDNNDEFGLITYNNVIKFQRDNKLPITGIVDQSIQQLFFKKISEIQQKSDILFSDIKDVKLGYFTQDNNFFITSWSNENWEYIIRSKSNTRSEKIAQNYKKCFFNYNICYSDKVDNSFYTESKKENMNFDNISVFCNTNNIELIKMLCIASGESEDILNYSKNYDNFIEIFKSLNNFIIIDSYNYTNISDYLKQGDILVSNKFITVALNSGSKVNQIAPIQVIAHVYKGKVTVNKLNIRSAPNKNSYVVSYLRKGNICTILEERQGWGKLKSGRGWVDLNFIEKL